MVISDKLGGGGDFDWEIIGRDPSDSKSQPISYMLASFNFFLYGFEVYSLISCTMIGNCPLEPVISQTPPVYP